jgi:hypothetical protein
VERGVSIGGSVKDEAGTAIADAKVFLKFPEVGDASFREPKAERLGFIRDLVAAKTDAEGRWTCALVPAGYDEFSLEIRHPHYSTLYAVLESDDRNYVNPVPRFKLKELLNGEANFVMRAGFRLAGIVLDDAGQPKAGAEVAASLEHGYEQGTVTTKADGAFEIGGLAAGAIHLSASADGFAPADQAIDVKASQSNLVLRLVRGTTVSIRVEDEDGNGVGGAWVAADVGERTSANWRAISEPNGVAQLSGIPESVRNSLQFHAGAQDFFIARNQRVDLSPPQPTIQLKRSLTVSGLVTDAESGEAIPWFKAIPCRGEGRARDGLGSRKFGTNGNFTVSFMEYGSTLRVRIEADGYEPAMSTPLSPRPATQSIELKLRRTDLSKAIRGVVLLPNGQPAVGADVALLTFEHGAYLNQGRIMRRGSDSILARTDGEGRFQFNADENAHSILVATDTAYGRTRIRVSSNVVAQLSAPGRIAGRVRTRDGSWANRDVMMLSTHNEAGFTVNYTTKSDSQGNFNFESVPALDYTVYLNPGTGKTLTDATAVEVRAGESTDVQIGGTGATITGRLNFGSANTLDWPGQIKRPILQPKYTPPPQAGSVRADRRSPDRAERIKELDLVETDEWRAWSKSQRPSIVLKVAADGSFSGEDLRAGEYTLRVELTGEKSNGAVDPIAEMRRRPIASIQKLLIVSEAQEKGGETIDVGVLELQPIANR